MDKNKIAIYLRLSNEDIKHERNGSGSRIESNSISSQRGMILDYISKHKELAACEILEFCDDGFSGTSMKRPGMQALLEQVKKHRISCIIVKDMSRFSREYIELGTYLNQIFPFMGIRFISLNDHYDSREHEGATIEIDTAFQTLLYDLYSKDISVKIKSSFQNKCENGEYVFGQTPLGYKKSTTEKNQVIINEEEAEIVRYIFALADEGKSNNEIVRQLYHEKIPTTFQLRHPEREYKNHLTWSSGMIRKILTNRFYLGEMAYGKSVRSSVGSTKAVAVPEEEWKVIQHHHEPLVTPELFMRVAPKKTGRTKKMEKRSHPFVGKIYCGGCGYSMNYRPIRKSNRYRSFECRKHSTLQIQDCCATFGADILEELVLKELYSELMVRGDAVKEGQKVIDYQKSVMAYLEKKEKQYQTNSEVLQQEKDALYIKYVEKQITAQEYRAASEKLVNEIKQITEKADTVKEQYQQLVEKERRHQEDMKQIIRFAGIEALTEEVVDTFIKRIYVYKGKRVEIQWDFRE